MAVRVVPVRAWRMGLGGATAPGSRPHDVAKRELEVGFGDALMRFERAAASLAGTLADLPVALRQNAKERVVPLRAIRIRSRLDVHAVRVQVRRVRAMRHVCRTGQAARVDERRWNVMKDLVEVFEDPRRRRGAFQTLGLRYRAERGLEIGGRNLERIRRRTFRHLSVIRAEHVSQLHAQHRIATRANRRPRARAVEAVEGGVAVAGRDRARQMAVAHDLQRQRLSRPLLRPPDPWLRPVFDAHRRGIRDGIRAGGCGGRAPCPDPGVWSPSPAAVAPAAPSAARPAAPICNSSRRASTRGAGALSSFIKLCLRK